MATEEKILVKGSLFLGLLKFTREKIGAEGREKLLKSLNDEARAVFFKSADSSEPNKILLTEWYPYKAFKSLLNSIIMEVGDGDIKFSKEIGYWSAEKDLDPDDGLLKFYTKDSFKGDASLIYRSIPVIWDQMYNKGKYEVVPFDKSKEADFLAWELITVVNLKDFPEATEAICLLVGGWMERATQIIGGYKTVVETKYKPAPGIDCEFRIGSEGPLE